MIGPYCTGRALFGLAFEVAMFSLLLWGFELFAGYYSFVVQGLSPRGFCACRF